MNDNLLKTTMTTIMTIMTIMTVRFWGKEPVTIQRKLGATYSPFVNFARFANKGITTNSNILQLRVDIELISNDDA